MLAKSHDGTFAPQHVIARHTYAETRDRMLSNQASLQTDADESLAELTEQLNPQPGERFRFYVHYRQGAYSPKTGDWFTVYRSPSELTRLLASRIAKLRKNPNVDEIVVLRGSYDVCQTGHLNFCFGKGFDPYFLDVAP